MLCSWLELENRLESGETVSDLLAHASREYMNQAHLMSGPKGINIPGAVDTACVHAPDEDVLSTQKLSIRLLDFEYAGEIAYGGSGDTYSRFMGWFLDP